MTSRLLALLTALALAAPAAAQTTSFPALCLSASPDEYVGRIEVDFGDTFSLYVCLTGDDGDPLPFALNSVQWALLTTCCGGSPALYVDVDYNQDLTHEGDPAFSVVSDAVSCLDQDFVVLARVDFNWLYEPVEGPFNLGAQCLNVAYDCEGGGWITTGLPLEVVPLNVTPAESDTWSAVKRTYR